MATTATKAQTAVTADTATNAITAQRAQVAVTAQSADTATVATNAHLLDGLGAAAFAPASGSTAYVAKGGDTMTGPLNVPANGLNVGNQLVVSGGKIGIGTSSPTKTLDVRDGASQSGSIHVGGTEANGDPKLITFGDDDFVHIGENAADDLMELKAGTFHFTGGNVGIGTASPASRLHVIGGITTGVDFGSAGAITLLPPDGFAHFHIDNGPAGGRPLGVLRFSYGVNPGDSTVLSMTQLGRVGIGRIPTANPLEVEGQASKTVAGAWLANSDARIKRDIRPLTQALEVIGRIRPVAFRYTEAYRQAHPSIQDHDYYNVIAQDFAEVFPEAVRQSGDKLPNGDPILQVDTYPASIHAIAAIQELNQKVEEREALVRTELNRRDAENAELKARLARLEQLVLKLAAKGE